MGLQEDIAFALESYRSIKEDPAAIDLANLAYYVMSRSAELSRYHSGQCLLPAAEIMYRCVMREGRKPSAAVLDDFESYLAQTKQALACHNNNV